MRKRYKCPVCGSHDLRITVEVHASQDSQGTWSTTDDSDDILINLEDEASELFCDTRATCCNPDCGLEDIIQDNNGELVSIHPDGPVATFCRTYGIIPVVVNQNQLPKEYLEHYYAWRQNITPEHWSGWLSDADYDIIY